MEKEHPLITEYRKTIPSKLENLRKLIEEVKKYQNKESLEELRKIVHKLTGNSGTYGFMRVSNFCKALDLDLQEKIKQFDLKQITIGWLGQLDLFYENVSEAFNNPDIKMEF